MQHRTERMTSTFRR